MKTTISYSMHDAYSFYLWPWDSHVQFSADGHAGDLLIMPTEKLHWPRRQAAGEATLEGNKPWVLMTQHVSQDGESEMWRWLPAVEPATLYRMCPLNQRWGRCHRDPEPSRLLRLHHTKSHKYVTAKRSIQGRHTAIRFYQCAGRFCPQACPSPAG